MKKFLSRLKRSKSGLAYVWAVSAATIIFTPFIYWILSVLLDEISGQVFGMYTFTGAPASAWLLVKALISALMGFVLFITLLWAAANAKAQSYQN